MNKIELYKCQNCLLNEETTVFKRCRFRRNAIMDDTVIAVYGIVFCNYRKSEKIVIQTEDFLYVENCHKLDGYVDTRSFL